MTTVTVYAPGVTVQVFDNPVVPPTQSDVIWFDDAVPAGASPVGEADAWTWVTANPAPFSGTKAHQSSISIGIHQHYFTGASAGLSIVAGDSLYAYVYLDPANPPAEVMLQWADVNFDHRAYWGANLIQFGIDGTPSRFHAGPLPALGQWVRLNVTAAQVGVEGKTLNGMAFTLHGGRATWDQTGKISGTVAPPIEPPVVTPPVEPPPVVTPPIVTPPVTSNSAWQSLPYLNTTIHYWDSRPVPTFVGSAEGRIPYYSKHTRGTYRPTNGRIYYGGGDHATDATLLPDDAGPSGANPSFYSMEPTIASTVYVETHRYLTDPAKLLQPEGMDEGALSWNTTDDTMLCTPVNAFNEFANLQPSNGAPVFIDATHFSLAGDFRSIDTTRRARIHLDHPDFPSYTPDQWYYIPSWIDVRITSVVFAGGVTTFGFEKRTDLPQPSFSRTGRQVTFNTGPGTVARVWMDGGIVGYDENTKKYYAGLLEWHPNTRTWTRRNFLINKRWDHGTDIGLDSTKHGYFNIPGLFVPAKYTGRGDEYCWCANAGGDGGWVGGWHFELNTKEVNFYVSNQNIPPNYVPGALRAANECFSPDTGKIYAYAEPERRLYSYNVATRVIEVVALLTDAEAADPGCGHCCWNEDLQQVEVWADRIVSGNGCPMLFLVDPATGRVTNLGNSLPNGERIRGDEFYHGNSITIADGGEFNPDGTDGPPPNRHVFIGRNLNLFRKLPLATHQRIVPVFANQAATEVAPMTTWKNPPWRAWGGFIVSQQGIAYNMGGGHSNYQGMDVDWIDLNGNGPFAWAQNLGPPFDTGFRRPHCPPLGDPIYGGGGSPYLWSDGTNWKPVSAHVYANVTTHPTLGIVQRVQIPTNLNVPITSNDSMTGLGSWNHATGRWTGHCNLDPTPLHELFPDGTTPADWSTTDNKLVLFVGYSSLDRMSVIEWTPAGGIVVKRMQFPTPSPDSGQDTRAAHWIGGSLYLLTYNARVNAPRLWLWDHAALAFSVITSLTYAALFASNPENVCCCADRVNRKMWFMVGHDNGAPPELYWSSFDSLGVLKAYPMVDGGLRLPSNFIISSGQKGLQYWNGRLWIISEDVSTVPSGTALWSMPVS